MKNIIILLFILLNILQLQAQQDVTYKIDEFTGDTITRTPYIHISKTVSAVAAVQFVKINTIHFIQLKFMFGSGAIFSIAKSDKLSFKLENNDVIVTESMTHEISCVGCGSVGFLNGSVYGTCTSYILTDVDLLKLKHHRITKVRINTTSGFIECSINSKTADKIITILL